MIRVLVSDKLSEEAIAILKSDSRFSVDVGMSFLENIERYTALLVRSQTKVTREIIQRASSLRFIGRAGIGLDNIDVMAAQSRNIHVTNTPLGNRISTAEHTIALLFALARHIPQANQSLKEGTWDKNRFLGTELRAKTLGVIGYGNIGKTVAEIARGIQMKVLFHDPVIEDTDSVSLEQLLSESDFITVHVPLVEQTKHLLSIHAFGRMKPGVKLIHAARGGIVDEVALLDALNSGQVSGAALDVFEQEPPAANNPLIAHPNVIVTPHIAASTREAQDLCGLQLVEKLQTFFSDF